MIQGVTFNNVIWQIIPINNCPEEETLSYRCGWWDVMQMVSVPHINESMWRADDAVVF